MLPFRTYLDTVDVLVFYLITITGIALVTDIKVSITGAIAAFLAFNFLFTVPYHTFFVANTHDLLALFAFLGLSTIISRLVTRSRARAREANRRHQQTETLYRLSIALISANDLDAVLTSIVEGVRRVLDLDAAAVLLVNERQLRVEASIGERLDLGNPELLAKARWTLKHDEPTFLMDSDPASPTSDNPPQHEVLLVPVATSAERIGVLVVARRHDQLPFDEEMNRLIVTFANQAALAIERSLLTEQRTAAQVLSRMDELKTALLSAVSHDLRTPLASIKASVTTLMQPGIALAEPERRELLEAIDEESDRLNRLVANLLDLSRIESGALKPVLDWYEPAELINEALESYSPLLRGRPITTRLPDSPFWIHVDFVMITAVLKNLLENAVKYSPAGSPIHISAETQAGALEFSVSDEGPGVSAGEETLIFDKFYRVEARHRPVGSGMGLAICRGFVEAHGGRIWVQRNESGGATFAFTVPLAEQFEPVNDSAGDKLAVS